jgi:hypothetical protein
MVSNDVSVYCGKMFSYRHGFSNFHFIYKQLKVKKRKCYINVAVKVV